MAHLHTNDDNTVLGECFLLKCSNHVNFCPCKQYGLTVFAHRVMVRCDLILACTGACHSAFAICFVLMIFDLTLTEVSILD